ncbi:hypothetical protein EN739_18980 [Mesorhizobium sp. M2A.F.Ca.ET.017.03.2.1]|uniref:hypothetical protein n=1 Tax=unclassified Mesorhizobium TaxID=325217 RepID=UPI000FCCAE4E|nr:MULTISPECIES: hypothetical protein [unclassified Mesorhizobium]RUW39171.1 hypothetical protein EOA37_21205 [Mesorhizobium sp. M2A.F.Ca.ET.015.02.1.1]RVC93987.1 hypothetical protein EN739_18980 [Mesorhizobium sp. M2A.F.Ca.ET.017.03.2.1]
MTAQSAGTKSERWIRFSTPCQARPTYAISFRDIPETYILGGRCILCRHVGPVDRHRIEKRHGAGEQQSYVGRHLRCLACGNTVRNHFTVVGCYLTRLLT